MVGELGGKGYVERRRQPEETVLHEAVRLGWAALSAKMTLPARVTQDVEKYLGCGQLARGFLHVRRESIERALDRAQGCRHVFAAG